MTQTGLLILVELYKLNMPAIAAGIGMNLNTFKSKYNRTRRQYKFSEPELEDIQRYLFKLAHDITLEI